MTVKPELKEQYDHYVELNSKDEYSKAVIEASEAVGVLLDEGKTAEEALEGLKGRGLSGYMAATAAKTVAHFHPRGEEVRVAWNKDFGAEDIEEGIVNPAVLNVDEKTGKMTPEVEGV
jgi:hypothetical protein